MRVRALTSFVSNEGAYSEGDVFELPDAQALPWLQARLIAREPEEPRTATKRPAETAVRRK
jgi:hypothetical protein